MSADSFNRRGLFHGASGMTVKSVQLGFQLRALAFSALCLLLGACPPKFSRSEIS